ncbi:hypothetical protein [Natrialba aegyptia]|uniref:Cobalamin synthesis protein P47K n=1 Tax=Natrialba aegyptia DSM 13077 TaxID=1227491 RepID=M0AGW5_9EURY|nr:hypothetical protein [Natrialba aegyptia]ELY97804.1 cobalamin synthesis protein P47K [Natrialba aegyptia DSM 13077]
MVFSRIHDAAKTTTLDHISCKSSDHDITVLVDALGEANLDVNLVADPLPLTRTLTLEFDQSDLDPTEFYKGIWNYLKACLLTDKKTEGNWDTVEDRFPAFEVPEKLEESEAFEHDSQEEIGTAE